MVLRMSISSVPGINSVFFASLPIDDLPIDKVWEKVFQGTAPVKAREEVSILSNQRHLAIPLLSRYDASAQQMAADKTVLLKAALEWRRRSEYPGGRIAGLASLLDPKIARLSAKRHADIDFKCLLPRQLAQALQDLRKPNWRLYVRNESLSLCMRVRDGAHKINLHDGRHLSSKGRLHRRLISAHAGGDLSDFIHVERRIA